MTQHEKDYNSPAKNRARLFTHQFARQFAPLNHVLTFFAKPSRSLNEIPDYVEGVKQQTYTGKTQFYLPEKDARSRREIQSYVEMKGLKAKVLGNVYKENPLEFLDAKLDASFMDGPPLSQPYAKWLLERFDQPVHNENAIAQFSVYTTLRHPGKIQWLNGFWKSLPKPLRQQLSRIPRVYDDDEVVTGFTNNKHLEDAALQIAFLRCCLSDWELRWVRRYGKRTNVWYATFIRSKTRHPWKHYAARSITNRLL